jgi:hypothetical protein
MIICKDTWVFDRGLDGKVTVTRQEPHEVFQCANVVAAVGKAMEVSCQPVVTKRCFGIGDEE